jgi:histidinol-phosphatase (PHP family)
MSVDMHVHTRFSRDSEEPMENQCKAAIAAGIGHIAFTEHEDYNPGDFTSFFFDHDAYWRELMRCRRQFGRQVQLLGGIEISEPHRHTERVSWVLSKQPWDVVLGSLHWVDGKHNCYLPEWVEPFGGWRPAMRAYFAEMQQLAAEGDYDVLAHIDYPTRYLRIDPADTYDIGEFKDEIVNVLRQVVARGKAIEINTNPLRRSQPHANPPAEVVKWFIELGGRYVTVGSDSHNARHTGANIGDAIRICAGLNLNSITFFVERQAKLLPCLEKAAR